jgi:pimeloyl-ACP methyl ester carboxylesterase
LNFQNTSVLVWAGSQWSGGANNQYPHKQQTISSYKAIDTILQYYSNSALYPNLKQIIVAGHSLGAQLVQRYAAVGDELNLSGIPVSLPPFGTRS